MPDLTAFDDAMLRHGRSVPAVNRLGGGAIAMAGPQQPWRVTGDTAAVYQLRQPSGRLLALRCPLDEPERLDRWFADRYRALEADARLSGMRAVPGSPLVGGIRYVPDGLLLPGPDFRSLPYPVVALDWIAGPTLRAAAERAAKAGDLTALEGLASAWPRALEIARGGRFSHGDLSPGNVMVRPDGSLAFVDYDSAAWPGSPPPPTTWPRPAFAHPSGEVTADLSQRDDFAALTMYVSLRSLVFQPRVFAGGQGPDAPLVFDEWDLRDPDGSPRFAQLEETSDPALRYLVGVLRRACEEPVERTPTLADVADGERATIAAARTESRRARRDERREVDAYAWPAPSARRVDPPRAASAPARPADPPQPAPAPARRVDPSPPAAEPERPAAAPAPRRSVAAPGGGRGRQNLLTRLNSLLMSGDDDAAWHFWEASGLGNDPEVAAELGDRMEEIGRRGRLRPTDPRPRSEPVSRPDDEPQAGWPQVAPAPTPPPVDLKRQRRQLVDRLGIALDTRDVTTVERLWPALRGEPDVSRYAVRAHAMVAERFAARIAMTITRNDDAGLLQTVAEAEAAGCVLDLATRQAVRNAREREQVDQALAAALTVDDRASLASLTVAGKLDGLALDARSERQVRRALIWPAFERALASDDDDAILSAYDDELLADPDAMSDLQRSRVRLAASRREWLETVRGAMRRRDLPALWEALQAVPSGADVRLSRVERKRIERLAAREEAVARLADALRDGPDRAIVEALTQVEHVGAALPSSLDWTAIQGVVDRISLSDAIREATHADPPDYVRLAHLVASARASGTAIGHSEELVAEGETGGWSLDLRQLERDMLRAAHASRLREAIAAGNDTAIAAAAIPDPYGVVANLSADQRDRVNQAITSRRGAP